MRITPNGGPGGDGGDYGPNTPGTTTNGFTEALSAAAGKAKVIIQGAFMITATTLLRSDSEIEFDNAALTLGANVNLFAGTGLSRLKFTGNVIIDGGSAGGFAGNGFLLNGCSDVHFNWDCKVTGFATHRRLWFLNPDGATPGRNITIAGDTITADSQLVQALDQVSLHVEGLQTLPGGMTAAPGGSIINIMGDTAAGVVRDVRVGKVSLDGGGIMTVTGLIRIFGAVGAGNILDVDVGPANLRNTQPILSANLFDGLDIARCSDVTVHDITVEQCFLGVSICANRVKATNIVARNCSSSGITIGDSRVQAENYSDISVSDSEAIDCGQQYPNAHGCGVKIASSAGFNVNRVNLNGVRARNTTSGTQKYGLSLIYNGTLTNIRVTDGEYSGYTAPYSNPAGLNLSFTRVGLVHPA